MQRTRISGTLTDPAGEVTAGVIGVMDVARDIESLPEGQLGAWRGELKLPLGTSVEPGEFTIRLDDGRIGRLVITQVRNSPDTKDAAIFVGKGPAPATP